MDEIILVSAGAIGGAVFGGIGYLSAKLNDGESFELKKFLDPVLNAAVLGAIGVYMAPQLGLGLVNTAGEAFGVGITEAYAIAKALDIKESSNIFEVLLAGFQKIYKR